MGRKAHTSRNAELVNMEQRRNKVAELYLQGYAYWPISQLLGIAQSTAYEDVEAIRKEWIETRLTDYDGKLEKEVRALDMQESELWKAWYRSCEKELIETVTVRRKLLDQPEESDENETVTSKRKSKKKTKQSNELTVVSDETRTVTRQMIGDPRFMAEITKVRELRCKLMGLLEDDKPDSPIINIWQQLQEMKFDRDRDPIEERIQAVRMLPPTPTDDKGIKGHPLDRNEPLNGFVEHMEDSDLEPRNKDDTPLDIPEG